MFRLTATGLAVWGLLAASPAPAAETISPTTEAINALMQAKWDEADITKPARPATDHEFVRRVFIDLIGRIPYPEEVIDYEQDGGSDKKIRLVKRLLYATDYAPRDKGRPVQKIGGGPGEYQKFDYAAEYAEHWADLWTVWTLTRSSHSRYRDQMHYWLETRFEKNVPYRDMVVDLITASGKTNENGAVNFVAAHIGEVNPDEKRDSLGKFDAVPITSRVTRLFLGLRTQCIQCHDHPFNKEWVQEDFWGVNAFFRQVDRDMAPTPGTGDRRETDNPLQVTVTDTDGVNANGIVFYERRDGKLMAARPNFLKDYAQAMAGERATKTLTSRSGSQGKTRREILADYVVAHDNFGKAHVNRIWGHLFGRGLNTEAAPNDFGSHNEVVHPDLLAKLAGEFMNTGYDQKLLLEWVCTSDVYGLSHVANPAYTDQPYNPYFARMPLKSMSPEVLFRSLMVATRSESLGAGNDKIETAREKFLNALVVNFGDDEGNEMTFSGTVIQALLLLNGAELNGEINRNSTKKGATAADLGVVRVIAAKHTDRRGQTDAPQVFNELFLAALSRHPTRTEVMTLMELQLKGRKIEVEVASPSPAKPQPRRPGSRPAKPAEPKTADAWILPAKDGVNDLGFYQDVFWALLNTNEFILNH